MGAIIRTRSRTQSGVCQSSFAEDISGASRSTLDGTCRTAAGRGPLPPATRASPSRAPGNVEQHVPERLRGPCSLLLSHPLANARSDRPAPLLFGVEAVIKTQPGRSRTPDQFGEFRLAGVQARRLPGPGTLVPLPHA